MMLHRMCATLTLIAAASGQPASAQNAVTPSPTAVVVFDSSGSMWGEIGSERGPKFERTREALRTVFAAHKGARAGLIVFGPSCTTADVQVPPGSHPPDVLMRPLDRLNPKSKGPVALGLKRAMGLFDKGAPGGVVLVLDGADNCNEDVCAVARDIAEQKPGLAVHLVSLGMTEADQKATRCIADLTGGRVFTVATGSELSAAVDGAVGLALKAGGPAVPGAEAGASAAAVPRKPEAPRIEELGPPHLVARAFLGDDTKALAVPIRWRVYRSDDVARPFLDITEPQFSVPLPSGSYVVEAAAGAVTARVDVSVAEKGPTPADVRFVAGAIALTSTRASEAADPLAAQVTVSRVASPDAAALDGGEPVAISPALSATVVVPPGRYLVTAERGYEKLTREIDVAKGTSHPVDVTLTSGQLTVAAVGALGEPLTQALVLVSRDDPDQPGGRREVARSGGATSSFLLPAGLYYVTVRSGHAETLDQIAVGAGARVERAIKLGVARLSTRVTIVTDRRDEELPVSYRVLDLQRGRAVVASSHMRTASFSLPAGTYRIVAEIGARNVVAERDVKLEAGAVAEVPLEAKAGELRLALARDAGIFASDRFWQVSDAGGRIVWRTSHQSPSALLAPGRYSIRCETGGKVLEKDVDLLAGRTQTVEFEP
ncbi:MAG: VWA domain-containing protein [Hyphomicrobiaceae bacterium]|nr:VWA domain-containing protein [Hyphomicrobiaceae bacterium]